MRFLRKAAVAAGTALLGVAVLIAADVPTGVVSDAVRAHVDGADAALGANVYAGDALNTNPGGTLRMRVGAGQLFMLESSEASLTQDHGLVDMLMKSGTAGLSGTVDDPLEIDTPVGTVRPANDKHAFGQVTITGAKQIIVTSYEGTLSLNHEGEERLIEAGRSYRATLAAEPASRAAAYPQGGQGAGTGGNHDRLILDAILIGGAGAVGYVVWHYMTESPSNP
ncbi:MAG TPA: hypothetical protein VJN69_08165 [Candidatus Acidoferrales bacterium]|nr:hypothetical protein [Candidatus Acidoferrales bacterium]